MAIGSGLGGSFGIAAESTYGTYQTPTKFYEVNKSEIKKTKVTVQGGGLAAGRLVRLASRRVQVAEAGTGSIEMELTNKSLGLILNHIFGGTVTPVQQGGTTAYLQSYTLNNNFGKSLTMQNGVPSTDGTVRVFTGKGGKVTKVSFSCAQNALAMVSLDVDFQKVSEVESLASPSYPTALTAFHFGDLSVSIGSFGSEAAVSGIKGITLDIEIPQDTDRMYAGPTNPKLKDAPIYNAEELPISGSIDLDFMNKVDFHDRFAADTSTSMVIALTSDRLAGTGHPESLTFTLPATFFNDTVAVLSGPNVVSGSVPFEGKLDLTNGAITCTYMSTDTTL